MSPSPGARFGIAEVTGLPGASGPDRLMHFEREAAHEARIIHRDLEPANVKVRDDGTVTVLDFGLAKALGSMPDALGDGATITSPALTCAA